MSGTQVVFDGLGTQRRGGWDDEVCCCGRENLKPAFCERKKKPTDREEEDGEQKRRTEAPLGKIGGGGAC